MLEQPISLENLPRNCARYWIGNIKAKARLTMRIATAPLLPAMPDMPVCRFVRVAKLHNHNICIPFSRYPPHS